MGKGAFVVAAMIVTTTALQGCAAVAIPLVITGAGIAAGQGTSYTLDGIAYRTFTAPVEDVRRATLLSFRRMDITMKSEEPLEKGRELVGTAGDRTVYVELEKLTSRTTRMRITAKVGWFLRDRATAGEFIVQTERALDDLPALTQKSR